MTVLDLKAWTYKYIPDCQPRAMCEKHSSSFFPPAHYALFGGLFFYSVSKQKHTTGSLTHTHTHTHTHTPVAYQDSQGNKTEEKVFKKRKVFKEDLKELTELAVLVLQVAPSCSSSSSF